MISLRTCALSTLIVGLCSFAASAPSDLGNSLLAPLSAPAPDLPHPPCRAGLDVPSEGLSLLTALETVAANSGTHLTYSSDVGQRLDAGRLQLIDAESVSAEAAWSVVEVFLTEAGCQLHELRRTAPRMLAIRTRQEAAQLPMPRRTVPAEAVAAFLEHPALQIQTTIELRHQDARVLANTLRSLLTDTQRLNVVPAGGSQFLMLQGNGTDVAGLVQMIRAVDQPPLAVEPAPAPAREAGAAVDGRAAGGGE
jgi:hypothetical protein